MLRVFLALILCLSFAKGSLALESGAYKAPKDSSKVIQVWHRMDQTIECRGGVDKLSLISPPEDSSKLKSWVRREDDRGNPALFTRAQVRKLLENDPHKDLLFVTVPREGGGLSNSLFPELEKFADELQYKRVVTIGWPDWNSIYVYRDTQDDTSKLKERPAEKIQ